MTEDNKTEANDGAGKDERANDTFPSQEEQELGAWMARGWDFEDPEVDEAAAAELDKLHKSIHGKNADT